MPASSSRVGLPYPLSTDTPDVPRDVKAVTDVLDATLGAPDCTSKTRPTANLYVGRLIFETDTLRLMRYDGAAWKIIATSNPPRARVFQTTPTSVPNNSPTVISFDTTDYDTDGIHPSSSSKLTIVTPGLYACRGRFAMTDNTTGDRFAALRMNGGTEFARAEISSLKVNTDLVYIEVAEDVYLNAGDYIELTAFQGSGAAVSATPGQYATSLSVRWLAA